MHSPKATKFEFSYRKAFWILVTVLVIKTLFGASSDIGTDADELVLKRELPQGDWLYVTRYGAMATDMDTLRFFISRPLEGNDSEILDRLNKVSEFLITDSELKDVSIQDTPNGIAITVKGAVYRYFSKEYVGEGNQMRSYRITLTQLDPASRE